MDHLKSKRLEIQLSNEQERQIEEQYALFEKKNNNIQKMCHELNKPFEQLLDEFKLEKTYASLERCIQFCKEDPIVQECIRRLRNPQNTSVGVNMLGKRNFTQAIDLESP